MTKDKTDNLDSALQAINIGLSILESLTASTAIMEGVSTMILSATSEKRALSDEEIASLVSQADAAEAELESTLSDPKPPTGGPGSEQTPA